MINSQQLPPHVPSAHMENPNQNVSPSPQLSQGYSQLQSSGWSGNKVCQATHGQNSSMEPYPQQINRFYQTPYSPHQNAADMSRYMNAAPNSHHSVPAATYNPQYASSRQSTYPSASPQTYQSSINNTCGNTFYGNVSSQTTYGVNSMSPQQRKYASSPLCPTRATQGLSQNVAQISHSVGSAHQSLASYNTQPTQQQRYINNYNVQSTEAQQPCGARHQLTPTSLNISTSQDSPPVQSTAVHSINQLSSIPTPPEASSLPGDVAPVNDLVGMEGSLDTAKPKQVTSPSFVLPCSSAIYSSSNLSSATYSVVTVVGNNYENSRTQNRTSGSSLQPPPNVDEGSQASSASASSSIPDEQNSMKANSKPNFSYPPTPNTLSSPGAASMSSFHDDLDCMSSPGWPRTPASPVANNNYEFSNIKRPDSLLKLYNLSEDPERRYFLDKLLLFNEDRGTPITQCPTISKQPLDVYRVYLAVKERGGFVEVTNAKRWKDIAGAIGVGASSSAAYTLRKQYMKLLLPFECKFDRGGIDPQPIINQVEASSRKKGKNTMNSGTQNHFNQGYPQTMDGYHHSNYSASSYPSSRYPCNTGPADYHCPPNTMHYPQQSAAVHPSSGTTNTAAASGQTHYSQYWHNQQQTYGYYKGNSAPIRPPVHNNNNSSNYSVNSNVCRYSNNVTSQAPEQEYYSQHYVPHQNPAVQNNSFVNRSRVQGDVVANTYQVNQVPSAQTDAKLVNYRGIHAPVENSQNNSVPPTAESLPTEHLAPRKQSEDSYVSSAGSSSCLSNDSPVQDPLTCYNGNYSSTKTPPEQCVAPPVNDCVTVKAPAPSVPQVPQPNTENTLNKASYQPNCSSSSSTATSIPCHSPSNFTPSQYSQQIAHHTEFQAKVQQNHASQYGQYVESQNENYRGSEGPPSFQNQQVDQNSLCKVSESPTSNIPVCQSSISSSPAKTTNYVAYSQPQPQVENKEHRTPPIASKEQYSRQPTKAAWPSEPQRQYPTPPAQSFPPRGGKSANKQMKCVPETARQTKAWPPTTSTEAPQTDSKPVPPSTTNDRVTDVPTPKTQPPASTLIPPNCFQLRNTRSFPPGSVEAVTPVYPRRKRYTAKDVSPLEAWRLMLALKSGLIGECTWALDVLSVLLCDNSSIIYFGLSHLPGLLEVLVEHYRRFLNVIFGLAEDLEVGSKTVSPKVSKSEVQSSGEISKDNNTSSSGLCVQRNHVGINCRERTVIFDTKNYTYETRCKKSVRIRYDEALFLIDPERKWDKYEGFDSGIEHWQAGGGDTSMYIETPFKDISGRVKFARDLELEKLKADSSCKNKFRAPVIIKNFSLKYYKRNSLPLPLLTYKGEPFVVLEKCSVDSIKQKHSAQSAESSDTDTEDEESRLSGDGGEACGKGNKRKADEVFEDKQQNKENDSSSAKILCKGSSSGTDVASSFVCVSCKSGSSKAESSNVAPSVNSCESDSSGETNVVKSSVSRETGVSTAESSSTTTESCSVCMGKKEKEKSDTAEENEVFFPRLRCSVSSRKKYSSEDLEDEANCFDEPALCTLTEQQESLTRRCMCISNILRNLSFVPGNDLEMKKHPPLLLLLGRLLLLHHEHKPITHQKYDKETKGITVDDSSVSLKDEQEWWWSLLHVLRDNTLVILSNISGQLDLTPFPEEISLSILDGLLHWVVCPSSYAQDPLPTQPSFSVLSPQRLSLEALCKLSVLENNVDLMIATPPWSRIESFFGLLTKLISIGEDQVLREFAIILLCNISQADSTAARAIAAQNSCISHLIAFIEQAETSAFQVASSQGIKALKENPELMGTTPDMVQRAASTLKCLASVPENRGLFFRHQQRLLAVATSQIMDQELATIIADILFCISEDESETLSVMSS